MLFLKKKNYVICIGLFLLIPFFLQAQSYEGPKHDTLFLANGEVLVGEIKDLSLGMLTIDSKSIGLISIKTSKIATISTLSDYMRIETVEKIVYYATIRPSAEFNMVRIVNNSGIDEVLPISHINTMSFIEKTFLKSARGTASAGFTYSHSSNIGQLTLNANISLTSRKFNLDITMEEMASIKDSVFSRDREEVNIAGYYMLGISNKWYILGELDYQRNLELSIARRFQQILGGGRKFIFSPSTQILSLAGLSTNQEHSTTGQNENFLLEIPIGFVFNYFKFSHPNLQFSSQNIFYASLSQKGRVRYDSNTSVSYELIKNLAFTWNVYLNYDRQPPDPTAGKIDYGTTVSLTYKF